MSRLAIRCTAHNRASPGQGRGHLLRRTTQPAAGGQHDLQLGELETAQLKPRISRRSTLVAGFSCRAALRPAARRSGESAALASRAKTAGRGLGSRAVLPADRAAAAVPGVASAGRTWRAKRSTEPGEEEWGQDRVAVAGAPSSPAGDLGGYRSSVGPDWSVARGQPGTGAPQAMPSRSQLASCGA